MITGRKWCSQDRDQEAKIFFRPTPFGSNSLCGMTIMVLYEKGGVVKDTSLQRVPPGDRPPYRSPGSGHVVLAGSWQVGVILLSENLFPYCVLILILRAALKMRPTAKNDALREKIFILRSPVTRCAWVLGRRCERQVLESRTGVCCGVSVPGGQVACESEVGNERTK